MVISTFVFYVSVFCLYCLYFKSYGTKKPDRFKRFWQKRMKVTNTFNLKGEEIAEYIKKRKLHDKENYGISFSNKRVG